VNSIDSPTKVLDLIDNYYSDLRNRDAYA